MTEYLDIEGGRIAYDEIGSGPLVVLSHGIGDRRQAFRFLAPRLAQAGYRVASADLRGHGESSMGWTSVTGKEAITRTDIAGRPARPDPPPRRPGRHRRAVDLRRGGHHRGGQGARTGQRHRGDRPVHPGDEDQPGRPAAQPPLPSGRNAADAHPAHAQHARLDELPGPGVPHQARRLRRVHGRAAGQADRARPDGRVHEDRQVDARRRRGPAAQRPLPGAGHHGHPRPRLC